MRKIKAQISIEYLIIVGFVIAAILVPAFLLLFSSTYKNVYGPVNTQKVADLGNGLVNDAKQMYYLGIYSKKISKYQMPDNVINMFILNITNGGNEYYYIGIVISDGVVPKVETFLSGVPLTSDTTYANVVQDPTLSMYIPECKTPGNGYSCNFYSFTNSTIMPGMKNFLVETVSRENTIKSAIVPLSQ
jgi:hypothetical protein